MIKISNETYTLFINERRNSVEGKVYLPSSFNHDEYQNVYDDCKKNLINQASLIIVGSAVERIGTAGVQILLAAGTFCQKNKKKCIIEEPSEALLTAFTQLGCMNIVKDLEMIP